MGLSHRNKRPTRAQQRGRTPLQNKMSPMRPKLKVFNLERNSKHHKHIRSIQVRRGKQDLQNEEEHETRIQRLNTHRINVQKELNRYKSKCVMYTINSTHYFFTPYPYGPCMLVPKDWKEEDSISNLWFLYRCEKTREIHHECNWKKETFGCDHCLYIRSGKKFEMCKKCIPKCRTCTFPHLPRDIVRPSVKHTKYYSSCNCEHPKKSVCLTCMYEYYDLKLSKWSPREKHNFQ